MDTEELGLLNLRTEGRKDQSHNYPIKASYILGHT